MKKVKGVLMICLVLGTVISYTSVLVSPESFKLSAGISVLIPFFLLVNLLVLLFLIFNRSLRLVVPLMLLLVGLPFFKVGLGFRTAQAGEGDFSIVNYNVKWFVDGKEGPKENVFSFLRDLDVDILCLQEFHNEEYNIKAIDPKGEYDVVVEKQSSNLAIFTKHRVLNSGVLFKGRKFNNIQYADLLVAGTDTIRIYNLHLQSMGINTSNLQDPDGIREEYDEVKTKFLEGASIRAEQINHLLDHHKDCKYPVLFVGDFNDVPFSYNYFQFRKRFKNAFEEAGSGFGVTYNGRLPFLRIDNQFYSKGLEVELFDTFNDVNYSDHFPILGIYSISD